MKLKLLLLLSFFCLFSLSGQEDFIAKTIPGFMPESELTREMADIFMEAKPADEDLVVLEKKRIESLYARYKPDNPIFKKLKYLYKPLPGGIDHLAAGIGTRNAGYGTIGLRGLPQGSIVLYSALYFGTIYGPGQPIPAVVPIIFQGNIVYAFLIGTSVQPCWVPGGRFAAYRAFVTPMVPGNGDYSVRRLPSFLTDGRNPWAGSPTTTPLSEGASLVVIYSHQSVPLDSFVQIHHVNQMFSANLTVTHFLFLPVNHNYSLKHTRLGADGQEGFGLFHSMPITDERTYINLLQIKGTGSSLDKDSDWNGYDGEPLNQLWDTHTMSIRYSIPNGATFYTVRYISRGDCIVPVAHVLTARY